ASQGHPPAPSTLYGDGIAIEGSSNNTVRFNTARRNGPYSGIGIYQVSDTDHVFPSAPAVNNLIEGNQVLDNAAGRLGGTCDNDGIRVEPSVSPGNRIQGNTVAGNGLDGISLFSRVSGTYVVGNQVYNNGFFGSASGDGIRVFGFGNFIQNNNTNNNRGGGISVARRTGAAIGSLAAPNGRDNQITFNTATGNVIFDLYDSNFACDNNTWHGNKWHTANQACTTLGGQQI
ncbi:MAG: right-handed parallel beta-helix repeat-containing protein, partial [Acidimicrobiales bacterium]